MPRLINRNPAYRKHKASGNAIVTLGGVDHYLGPWKSPSSKREYNRLIREWNASGGILANDDGDGLTVVELLLAYWGHAKTYYVDADGHPTSQLAAIKLLIRRIRKLYGDTPATKFGPLRLKAFRDFLIEEGSAGIASIGPFR